MKVLTRSEATLDRLENIHMTQSLYQTTVVAHWTKVKLGEKFTPSSDIVCPKVHELEKRFLYRILMFAEIVEVNTHSLFCVFRSPDVCVWSHVWSQSDVRVNKASAMQANRITISIN